MTRLWLHVIEDLPVPLLLPCPGLFAMSELHQDHVSVCSCGSDHPEMTDFVNRLLTHKAEEVRRWHIGRDSKDAEHGTVLVCWRFVLWQNSVPGIAM